MESVLKSNQFTLLNLSEHFEPERKKYKRSSTGYRGVTKQPTGYRVRLSIGNRKMKSLGMFDTAIKAALVYDQAAIKAGRNKSTLNFPNGLPGKSKTSSSSSSSSSSAPSLSSSSSSSSTRTTRTTRTTRNYTYYTY